MKNMKTVTIIAAVILIIAAIGIGVGVSLGDDDTDGKIVLTDSNGKQSLSIQPVVVWSCTVNISLKP